MSADDPNQLVELSYISKATHDMGLSSLVHLFDVARRWNLDHELTGALFYENGHFAQILEGKRKDVPHLVGLLDGLPSHDVELLRIMRSVAKGDQN